MGQYVRFFLVAVFLVSLLWGCGSGGGSSPAIVVAPPVKSVESTAVSLAIIDTLSSAPITNASLAASVSGTSFTVTISGDDADKVFNGVGTATTIFPGVENFLTFYIRAIPADYPLNLRIVVKNLGFVTNSQTLQLSAPTSTEAVLVPVTIDMTRTQLTAAEKISLNTEVGIDVQTTEVTSDPITGTTAEVVIETMSIVATTTDTSGATATGSGTTKVTIPVGTGLTTKSGADVTGALTATVTYHNPIDASSLDTFPGGLSVREEPNGTAFAADEPSATFISGGFTSIEIVDADGNEVRNFDTPITITMTVPQNLGNPTTGAPIAVGDVVPLWSYDTDSGEWTVHKDASGAVITGVVGDGDGDGVVDVPPAKTADGWLVGFPTNHLSYFNLDWFAWYQDVPGATSSQCGSTPLRVVGAQGNKIYFQAAAIAGGFTHDAWLDVNPAAPGSEVVDIANAPSNLPMRYTAYLNSKSDANKLNSVEFADLCQSGGVTFNIDQALLSSKTTTYADVTVNVYDRCTNDTSKVTPVPSSGVNAFSGAELSSVTTDALGSAKLTHLEVGKTYTILTTSRAAATVLPQQLVVAATGNTVNFYFDQTCQVEDPITGTTGGTGGTL